MIDDSGYVITIGQALTHSSISGDAPIDGGLTKIGTGALTLTGVNTYTGPTIVNQGTLAMALPSSSVLPSANALATVPSGPCHSQLPSQRAA